MGGWGAGGAAGRRRATGESGVAEWAGISARVGKGGGAAGPSGLWPRREGAGVGRAEPGLAGLAAPLLLFFFFLILNSFE